MRAGEEMCRIRPDCWRGRRNRPCRALHHWPEWSSSWQRRRQQQRQQPWLRGDEWDDGNWQSGGADGVLPWVGKGAASCKSLERECGEWTSGKRSRTGYDFSPAGCPPIYTRPGPLRQSPPLAQPIGWKPIGSWWSNESWGRHYRLLCAAAAAAPGALTASST